ncbi:MAG: hypothetical protein NZ700_12095 [Gemmataceae bacterium]|nr:hypothetical protein [Gemmataceae bacterium]MDW8267031.1 hypothetical protein [Gemmataceae bacterium]
MTQPAKALRRLGRLTSSFANVQGVTTTMPSTVNKQRLLTQLLTILKKRYEPLEPESRPVLEQLLYAICREGTTRALADRAFHNLKERFFDWNEVRVSSPREIAEALGEVPQAGERAQRLISLLQEVFETTFSFDLDGLRKKGVKQAAKQLARYQATNDFVVSWVVQRSLDGHAVPLDSPSLRVLRRVGLVEGDDNNLEAIRSSLEHVVPKAKAPLLAELLSALADELCVEDEPRCGSCPLCAECPTGQEALRSPAALGRVNRPKPR